MCLFYLKVNNVNDRKCKLTVSNVAQVQSICLNKGNWVMSVLESDQMEISCSCN